ncbi:hypothetical protein PanWU01x14_240320 [Parasponia andersonii]|uniref:Uncharacterized protein n=1 Tax=Parasponia andersonii TaxID=3476 RepID=A0A2P5BGX3_PARAD|nr:hypothetical protein PanWU01x14_240320 [Parasponia andersonii]
MSIEPRVLMLEWDMCCSRQAHAKITHKWCGGHLPLSEQHVPNTRRAHAAQGKAFSKSTPVSG